MRILLWLIVLLLPLAGAQNETADPTQPDPGNESAAETDGLREFDILRIANIGVAVVFIGAFVYFARR